MSLDNIQDSFIFELEYKVMNKGKAKILDESFVNKNLDKCKIFYNEKEYKLAENFEFENNYNYHDSVKIQLKINNNITDISNMFYECKALLSIKDISNLDNSNNINVNESFSEYKNISEKTNNSFESEKSDILYNDNLSSIPKVSITSDFTKINDLINNENILSKQIFKNVTNMKSMFEGCSSLITLPDISKWNTKNVTDMKYMFEGCSSLISLPDISKWNTQNVTVISDI